MKETQNFVIVRGGVPQCVAACALPSCAEHISCFRVSPMVVQRIKWALIDSRPIGIDHGANTVKSAEHECRTSKEEARQANSVWRERCQEV